MSCHIVAILSVHPSVTFRCSKKQTQALRPNLVPFPRYREIFFITLVFRILRFTHDSRVVAEFGENRPLRSCRKVVWYCLQKRHASGTLFSPAPLSRLRPKFRERCPPLTWVCVPTLVRIGCGFPDLFPKESKKSIQYRLSAYTIIMRLVACGWMTKP